MIKLFDEWIKSKDRLDKEFIILGKGPTINLLPNIDLDKYISIGLNHLGREKKVDIAHAIDYEVIKDCGPEFTRNAEYLLMPWVPNVGFRPHTKNLQELCEEDPVLMRYAKKGHLLTYNRKGYECSLGGVPINPIFFSGDTVFQLLSFLGEKMIYSLGVDGGTKYGESFKDITPLENGRNTFDEQFNVIKEISKLTGSKFIKVGELEKIKVFVGSQHEQVIPAKVLKNSIRKHTRNPVEFTLLHENNIEYKTPNDPRKRPRTPFSFQRFLIPSLTEGKAFYLDSDMQVFGDMAELLEIDFGDYDVLSCGGMDKYSHWKGSEYAFLLIDCDKVSWDIHSIIDMLDTNKLTYEELMFDFKIATVGSIIDPNWNSLDTYEEGVTKLLHYTDMNKQPWRYKGHPFEYIWKAGLMDSLESGVLLHNEYSEHIDRNIIRNVLQKD